MCFGNKKIPDQLVIKVCFYAGVMTLGNRRSSRCIFTVEHRQARQIVLVLIALQTLMLGKEGGKEEEREVIFHEWIFTNVNAFYFACEHRAPGTNNISFFGLTSLENIIDRKY